MSNRWPPPIHRVTKDRTAPLRCAILLLLAFAVPPKASAQMVTLARNSETPARGAHGNPLAQSVARDGKLQTLGDMLAQGEEIPGNIDDMLPKRWVFNGGVSTGYEYDDNVSLHRTNKTSSGIFVVRPYLGVKYGPMASGLSFDLNYAPSFEWFQREGVGDSVNHNASATVNWDHGPVHAFATLNYSQTDAGDIDAGARISRDMATAALGLTYDYSDKTSFGVTYNTEILSPDDQKYIGSNRQVVGVFGDYKVTGKTTLGVGGEYEFEEVDRGSDSNAYRVLFRTVWAATPKLTLHAVVGPEVREYTDADSGVDVYWKAGIDYNFLDTGKTTFAIDLYRNEHTSIALANQAYTATGVVGSLTYNATARLQFTTAMGYEFANYTGTDANVFADRNDHLYFIRPSITYAFNTWASISAFYQWSQNESSGLGEASFERNTFGVMMNIDY